ncbi:uncharacterized protein [Lolium perenne]|uniref:uncharacterized protein isoform X2 n=1 Tax=Lolium perenne TaxID=4522 RepID=UPI0021F50303|nr:uncharacterized protein LOC127312730 isoform X2 [Lolium perenne]
MDKSWMNAARHTEEYIQGLARFLGYAFAKSSVENKILCPCKNCVNSYWREERIVREHLICEGFTEGYSQLIFHGESGSSSQDPLNFYDVQERDEGDDISALLRDLGGGLDDDRGEFEDDGGADQDDPFLQSLHKLEAESRQELYPGCKNFSKLRFLVRLLHTKMLGGWSDKSFNLLLDLLKEAYPESAIPKNCNEAKKLVKCMGLGYVKIDACENDCILFWKDNASANSCPKCKASRWKSERKHADGTRVHKVPKKVLRYFPIKKRLQRLFACSRTAALTRWHAEDRTQDGLLRHPADSLLWKDFEDKNPKFAKDSRSIRLALATDGFNPFRSMNLSYSIWPVLMIPYNFSHNMVMKQPNFILSLLIPGQRAPGSDIDVYFEPLVDDMLDMFFDGVRTYDASKGEFFQLYAAIICTITEMVARREAEHRMSTLEEQVQQMEQRMNKMQEMMSRGGQHLEAPSSQNGSNSRQNSRAEIEEEIDGEDGDEEESEDGNVQRRKIVANPGNSSTQQDESLIGMDVLLYAWTGPETPVAKATVLSVDPDIIVGGEPLGPGTYEVIVNVAIKRDTILPYQCEDLLYIRDAVTRSIAWPSSKIKPYKPAASTSSRR